MANPAVPAVVKVSSAQGEGEGEVAALLRLIPYLVAIHSWSLELEFSEANHFGKVDKAVCFAVIKLFTFLFKMSKCKMVMGCGYVAQNKSTCPPSAACRSVQSSGVTWAIIGQEVPVSSD